MRAARLPHTVKGLLVLVAAVMATGIGILLLRLGAAGFTFGDALARMELTEVVAVGVSQMAFIAVAGLVGVGVAWGIGHSGTRLGHAVATTMLALGGIVAAILMFDGLEPAARRALAATGGVAIVALVVALATTGNRVHRWLKRHGRKVAWVAAAIVAAVVVREFSRGEWLAAALILVLAIPAAVLLRLALIPAEPHERGLKRLCQWLGGCVRTLAGPGAVVVLAAALKLILGTWAIAALVVLAGILIWRLMIALSASRRRGPRRYALCVFVAVQVFGTALIALHAWEEPRFRPVAVRLADGTEASGFLLSDTPASVYVADVDRCHRDEHDLVLKPGRARRGSATVTGFLRTSVRETRIGDAMSMNEALDRAPVLLNELRADAGLSKHRVGHPCADEGEVDLRRRTAIPLPHRKARELAARYRPILHFDSREPWRPVNVDQLLTERLDGRPLHHACRAPWACDPLEAVEQLADPEVLYVDLGGERLGGDDARAPDLDECGEQPEHLRDCDGGPRSAIYYRAVSANDRVYIDYWWFLRYNHFRRLNAHELCRNRLLDPVSELRCGEHEGDWEGVTAVTAVGDPQRLEFVTYAAHEFAVRHQATEERPRVFIADGSHAAYAEACPGDCEQFASIFVMQRPETNTDGQDEWARNDEDACEGSCLLPLPDGGWNAFRGLWGSVECVSPGRSCELGDGPKSPSRQSRFNYPWCYTSRSTRRFECDTPPNAARSALESGA